MRHPDAVARLLRPRSTWRDLQPRGDRDFDALDWRDAALALGGSTPLAYAAFRLRYSDEQPDRSLVQHLLGIAREGLSDGACVTPETLVEIALREERTAESRRSERARFLFAGVKRSQWIRDCRRAYALLGQELDTLVGDAWRVARRRLEAA